MMLRALAVAALLAFCGCATGSVTVKCSTCKGAGKVKCTNCTAAGMAVCDLCKGWGVQCCKPCLQRPQRDLCERCKDRLPKCVHCKGTAAEDCGICVNGVRTDGKPCPLCKGKGTLTCHYCKEGKTGTCVCCGSPITAEIRATSVACVPCAGKGSLKCTVCKGVLEVTCSHCNGSGKVKSKSSGGSSIFKHRDWD